MREKLDPEVFLRVHVINRILYKQIHISQDERSRREQMMEDAQIKKKNSFLGMITQFTNMHTVPT